MHQSSFYIKSTAAPCIRKQQLPRNMLCTEKYTLFKCLEQLCEFVYSSSITTRVLYNSSSQIFKHALYILQLPFLTNIKQFPLYILVSQATSFFSLLESLLQRQTSCFLVLPVSMTTKFYICLCLQGNGHPSITSTVTMTTVFVI